MTHKLLLQAQRLRRVAGDACLYSLHCEPVCSAGETAMSWPGQLS